MSNCNDSNLSWDANLDFRIIYSGLRVKCNILEFEPNENIRDVIMKIGDAICKLSEGTDPIPAQIFINKDITFQTTGAQLNTLYSNAVLGTVVHNDKDIKFTKISPSKWEFEIIELR